MIVVERNNGNVIYLNNVKGEIDKGANTFIFYDGARHEIHDVKKVTVLEGNLVHETLCDI